MLEERKSQLEEFHEVFVQLQWMAMQRLPFVLTDEAVEMSLGLFVPVVALVRSQPTRHAVHSVLCCFEQL
jgi:hypothetical protein